MPQPLPSPPQPSTCRITHITDLLETRRTRIASLRLLSLDADFLDDLAAAGDLPTLVQIGCLFQCLMETPYICGFSKPVDRAITRLLLHATKGCDGRLSRLRSQHAHDRLCWLLPSEVETKEILETYRSFLHYITCQHNNSTPVKDPSLGEAKRRLQKLCPKINNLSSWSPSPTREAAGNFWTDASARRLRSNHGNPSSGVSKSRSQRASARLAKAPTPPPVSKTIPNHEGKLAARLITPPDTIPGCNDYLTVPTLRFSRPPGRRVLIPRRTQRNPSPQLRVVDGMVEEVTQPFTAQVDVVTTSKDSCAKADAQLKHEYAEWRERHLRPFLRFSPEASAGRDSIVAVDGC